MRIFEGFKSVIGFLTILPVGKSSDLAQVAKHMYLFPLVGAFVGFLAGSVGWLGLHLLPATVVGVLVLGFLIFLNGFHHIDGLLDFGDGVMTQGSSSRKIDAMHDERVGTGGVGLGLVILLMTAFCIAELEVTHIIPALIAAEVLAKFSMVVVATSGKSAYEGMSTNFIEAMHDNHGNYRFSVAFISSLGIALVSLKIIGLVMLAMAIFCALAMVVIANRQFKGVTGDIFGATNEITRAACIIAILVMLRWV